MTQKQVADNLDAAAKKIHQEEAALEKDKARLEQIEQAAEAAERNIDQQIKQKKDELAHMPAPAPVKIEVKEEKKGEDSKK